MPSQKRFVVGSSGIDGKGLFVRSSVRARAKLGELGGELISEREARRRAKGRRRIAIVEFGDGQALDATGGNEFRFVNHSCTPNAFIRIFGHRVEFYARRRIEAGEEITCGYGETQHAGTLRCRCGSERCQGYL